MAQGPKMTDNGLALKKDNVLGPGDRGTGVPGKYKGPGDRGTRVPREYKGPGYQGRKFTSFHK